MENLESHGILKISFPDLENSWNIIKKSWKNHGLLDNFVKIELSTV
jgi:hypothetical protein